MEFLTFIQVLQLLVLVGAMFSSYLIGRREGFYVGHPQGCSDTLLYLQAEGFITLTEKSEE